MSDLLAHNPGLIFEQIELDVPLPPHADKVYQRIGSVATPELISAADLLETIDVTTPPAGDVIAAFNSNPESESSAFANRAIA